MHDTAARNRRQRPQPDRDAPPRPAGPAPSEASLRDAAMAHLARYATTEAGMVRVLDRRIHRWSMRAVTAGEPADQVEERAKVSRQASRSVAAALVKAGVLDDAAYAEARARSLTRSGRSRRAIGAHLGQRGIDADLARASLPDDAEAELAAALTQARRRRIGPFQVGVAPEDATAGDNDNAAARNRALGMLARAGFSRDVAERALAMERDEAERLILQLKRL